MKREKIGKRQFFSFEGKWRPLAKDIAANKGRVLIYDREFFEMPYTHYPLTDEEILEVLECPLLEDITVNEKEVTFTVINF